MKKVLTFFACFISLTTCFAQEINRRDLEDSVIGWIKVYNFKGAKQPMTVDGKVYSVAQMSICDSLANWIQASYIPKGGLGDVIKELPENWVCIIKMIPRCRRVMELMLKHISF